MRLLHRITAAVTTVFLLQLTLLGSGTLCTLQGGVSSRGMAGMGGMHEAHGIGPATGSMSSPLQSPSSNSSAPQPCDGSQMGSGCGQPWAPGQCIGMTICAAAATPTNAIAARVTESRTAPALPEPASIASGLAIAPEIPPPRA